MQNDNEWIEWTGGECPVPHVDRIDVKLRNGFEILDADRKGWDWNEGHSFESDSGFAIVAYRVSK